MNSPAMTMGSLVTCGSAPWPPIPRISTSTEVEPASAGPLASETVPAARVLVSCSAIARSGAPKRSYKWSASIALAPSIVSSDGWPISITVPCHLRFRRRKHARRADHRGHMHVVAAGVHHPDFLTGGVLALEVTGIGHAGFLHDGKRVHVGTNQQLRPRTILQYRDHPIRLCAVRIFADPLGNGIAGLAQFGRQQRRGVFFPMR